VDEKKGDDQFPPEGGGVLIRHEGRCQEEERSLSEASVSEDFRSLQEDKTGAEAPNRKEAKREKACGLAEGRKVKRFEHKKKQRKRTR